MVEDKQLIAQYAAEGAEAPFSELVRRHLNLVYATALRQVNGDCHLAEDIAQTVFADLARKAKSLTRTASIAGWLYTSARFAAANAVRSESRRRAREEAASAMIDTDANPAQGSNELRFLVDDALEHLAQKDREAIVLRYFESSDFAAVGVALGVSQNAARMRVERSLEKLRAILEKRGLTTSSAVLAATLSGWAGKAAPAELAATVVKSALTQAATTGAALSPFAKLLAVLNSKTVGAAAVLGFVAGAVFVAQRAVRHEAGGVLIPAQSSARGAALGAGQEASSIQMPKGDPRVLQRLLERHDARLKAERAKSAQALEDQWNTKLAAFADWLKDEPGIKKFGARVRMTVESGQTLVTGGWSNNSGKRTVVFLTPTQIDPAGNLMPAGTSSDQIVVSCHLVEASDTTLDSLGLQSLSASGNESTIGQQVPTDHAESILQALAKTNGVDVLSSPRVVTLVSRAAEVSVGSNETIAGKQQDVGLRVSILPFQAGADGSVELGVTVRLAVPIGLAIPIDSGNTGGAPANSDALAPINSDQ